MFTVSFLRNALAGVFLLACSHLLAGGITRADGVELSEEEIDATVLELMSAGGVPGLALGLIQDEEIAYLATYGFADNSKKRQLDTDTIMYAASLTKPTFAWMVMTLVDEGRVDLDRPIAEYLPKPLDQYEEYTDLRGDDRWREWTLRALLSHQSGLPNWRWIMPGEKLEIIFEPGSRYAYSGEGFQVAQLTLEQGLQIDIEEAMQQRVFDRFGMARTSMTWREDFRPNFSRGHGTNGEIILHRTWANAGAAGSMDTTVEDYSKFVVAVLSGEGLSESARAEMLGEQVEITARRQFPTQFPEDTEQNQAIGLSYGLGWGLFDSNFGPAFFKEGHDDGTNNYVLCLQESKRCMVVLSNSSNGEGIFLYLANALLGDTGLPWEWEGYIPFDRE